MPSLSPLLLAAVALYGAMALLWLLSLRLKDSSIVDLFWGPAFALVAWVELLSATPSPRGYLLASLVTVWALRLGLYLAWRNHGRGEDPRYVAMRARHGAAWPLRSLFIVFFLQGTLVLLVGLPLHAVMLSPQPALGLLDALGALVFAVGLAFESLGDLQLARFKSKPEHRGQVMDRGLWRYTRHPNYFGDFLVWWGLYGLAASSGLAGLLSAVGPAVMTVLLLRVSGVSLLEQSMKDRPGYAGYIARTSAFFPRPPRG